MKRFTKPFPGTRTFFCRRAAVRCLQECDSTPVICQGLRLDEGASLQRIKTILTDERQPRPVLLLGAGASRRSGIPTARDLTDQIVRWAYCIEHNRDIRDQTVSRSDWVLWLRSLSWYDPRLSLEERYPLYVERLLQPREERKRFFDNAIRERLQPSGGYRALADLVGKGWVRSILTTNFDDLVYESCRASVDSALIVPIKDTSQAHLISTDPTQPQVIHLHGAIEHYTDRNLVSETLNLPSKILGALHPLLRDHPLIVMGYRGAEPSIMKDLLIDSAASCNRYRQGIYWCHRANDELHSLVNELRQTIGPNFIAVRIDGFDEAMNELNDGVGRSARAPLRPSDAEPRVPELEAAACSIEALDWTLIAKKLPEVASRLAMDVPARPSRGWMEQALLELQLLRREGGHHVPTRAGELIFSSENPSSLQFEWNNIARSVSGNLCELIEELADMLSEVNAPFRLKGPVSEDVRRYPPLALKELLVNSIVHRDHTVSEAIQIRVSEDFVQFRTPGALVDTVKAEQLGRLRVKGYRNPIIANFFFGTGDMDKHGSGLVDVRQWAREIGGDAIFVESDEGSWFSVDLLPRPERPTDGVDVAAPSSGYEVFFANAFPLQLRRGVIYVAPTNAKNRRDVFERLAGEPTAPFKVQSGELLTLSDLLDETNPLTREITGPARQIDVTEFCDNPDDERAVVELLNESFRRHVKNLGLLVLDRDQRIYFPRTDEGEKRLAYRARVRDARRTVVKTRTSRTTGKTIYWEHHSAAWRIRRFGSQWFVLLVPGWVFTRDGVSQLLDPRRNTSLSTRRAARDYNPSVSSHLFFWGAMLAGDEKVAELHDGSEAVTIERRPARADFVGAPAAPGQDEDDGDGDPELDELEDELESLADDDDGEFGLGEPA